MTTEEGLLAAVLENPDDDLPRLALCDWWEENGQHDRAAFTRRQLLAAGEGKWCLRPSVVSTRHSPQHPGTTRHAAPRYRCRCQHCTNVRRMGELENPLRVGWRNRHGRAASGAWWRAERFQDRIDRLDREVDTGAILYGDYVAAMDAVCAARPTCRPVFARGFVAEVCCNPAFARHGLAAVLAENPIAGVYVTESVERGVFVQVTKEGGHWFARHGAYGHTTRVSAAARPELMRWLVAEMTAVFPAPE